MSSSYCPGRTFAIFLLGGALFSSCGHRLPPPGGPEDTEGPVLLETVPAQNAVGVELSSKIRIVFGEDLDSETVRKAVMLSPEHEELEAKGKGEVVELSPRGDLFPLTTYQVTVKSTLLDERGNSFAGPFTFYFSTGDSLDTGLIQGKVAYRGKGAAGAYVTASALPESIRYSVQADTTGKYRLAHLPRREFSLMAFLDQNNDGEYRFAVEPVAYAGALVGTEPVKLDFDLAVIDTSPPVLQSVEAADSSTIRLVFDDPMERLPTPIPATSVELSPEEDTTLVVPIASVEGDTAQPEAILVRTESPLADGIRYRITVTGLKNESGLPVGQPGNRMKFTFTRK